MSLTTIIDDMVADIHAAQMKAHRLNATARRLQGAINEHLDMHFVLFRIFKREGIILEKDEDIPRALEALIAKLKEGSDATS